jgi:hypothetical protein
MTSSLNGKVLNDKVLRLREIDLPLRDYSVSWGTDLLGMPRVSMHILGALQGERRTLFREIKESALATASPEERVAHEVAERKVRIADLRAKVERDGPDSIWVEMLAKAEAYARSNGDA